jgi:acyl-CoA synthetase (AMP-forming)/AMP-acid ligase II
MPSLASVSWGTQIAAEQIGGVPLRMYSQRPRRVEHLLAFAFRWGARLHIVQGERVVTFDGLLHAIAAKARELVDHGVGRGDRIFLLGWNGPEWIVNFWACLQLGAIPVLANAWWSESELADALTALQPAITLADAHGAAKIPPPWRCGPWKADLGSVRAPIADAHDGDATSLDEEDPAVIIFTSGTEGRPKAVVLSHRALLAGLQMLLHITRRLPHQLDETAGDVGLHTGPLFHIGGVQTLIRAIMVGDTLVMPRGKFDPAEALSLIERHKISRWSAVPTMVSRLLEHPDVQRKDLRSLRSLTVGGAPVYSELLQRIPLGFPSVEARIPTGYGLTENGGQATAASGADTAERPGSSGRPLPCVELKLLPRPGLPDGEILVRSPTQMSGYYGTEQSPIDQDGWLHTGDLGRLDERGHLWITGRCKDMIIRGGENIAPAALERVLVAIPGVAEAAVIGIPHPDLGEEVMAIVVVEGAHTAEQLKEQLRTRVASFAVPSRWRLQKAPLPLNHAGKVDKAALIAQARAEHVRQEAKAAT